ncbi:MAG TPA: MBL fold metallo-hydrolase [Patescibacteria group bacterium]
MSKIKSFSVEDGDMFYINHNTDNFTIIDCSLSEENQEEIIKEIKHESSDKGVTRFISTHPDEDHIQGLEYLDSEINIINFYCTKNQTTKDDESEDFKHYRKLHDSNKAFYIEKGSTRKWMNISSTERDHAGISILWPVVAHESHTDALKNAEAGESPNNISPIIKYSVANGATVLWMGDLETDFMEKIKDVIDWLEVDILFVPHHGRDTGKIPDGILKKMNPKLIVIGEAPVEHLNYYDGYNTITQNSAGDIVFECTQGKVHVFVSSEDYFVDFLDAERNVSGDGNYIGTLNL